MIAWFFGKTGHRTTRITPNSQLWMVHSHLFASCLPRNQENQPRRRITPHQDISSSNTSAQTNAYLSTQNIHFMGHPLYSPDLASNDFFLFPYVKHKMRIKHFSTPEEAADMFRMNVLEVLQSEWQKCIDNWFKRMPNSIDRIFWKATKRLDNLASYWWLG